MPASPEPPPPPPRRRFLQDLLDSLRDLSSIGKACTCGNPNKTGPCPRHGKLY